MDVACKQSVISARDFHSMHSREAASTKLLTEAKHNKSFLKKSKLLSHWDFF